MLGDLPPSSTVEGISLSAAQRSIWAPTSVEPVKASFWILSLVASAWPASAPKPLTTLTTPGGRMSLMRSIISMMVTGVCSAGLSTLQQPAASTGASFQAAISSGKFQGMIWPTTPMGSLKW